MAIRKLENNYKTNIQVGAGLTLEEFANIVHSQRDGYVTVCTKNAAGEWTERSFSSQNWIEHVIQHEEVSCYYSVNSFYKQKRANVNARHINCFYVDIDYYNENISQQDALDAIDFNVKKEMLPEPSLKIDSGRGLYAVWLIESAPGAYASVRKLYSRIENYLVDVLSEQGADKQATDVARVLRVPSSYNHKNASKVEVLEYNKQNVYTMRYFQQIMNDNLATDYDVEEVKKRKEKEKKSTNKSSKIKRLFNFYTLAIARARDVEKIVELRDSHESYRNKFIHVYMYQMLLIHNHYYVARAKTLELANSFDAEVDKRELEDVMKSVFRAYEEHREDAERGYNYKTETLVKLFDLTLEEQRQMQTLISQQVKQERDATRKKGKRRNKDGLTAREQAKIDLIHKVNELNEQGFKKTEIASELGITRVRVHQLIKESKV